MRANNLKESPDKIVSLKRLNKQKYTYQQLEISNWAHNKLIIDIEQIFLLIIIIDSCKHYNDYSFLLINNY